MKLAILSSLLLTSIVSAATIPFTEMVAAVASDGDIAITYPTGAQASHVKAQLTNAELIRLGQPLAKPVRLYDAEALAKRLEAAAPQASSMPPTGGSPKSYQFLSCAGSVSFINQGRHTVNRGDNQQFANECATRSQADGPSANNPERFVLVPGNSNNCYTRITSYSSAPCTTSNFAIYEVVA